VNGTSGSRRGINAESNRAAGGFLPQPPHHPHVGSARGGSQRLPDLGWVMNAHSQLFDRQRSIMGGGY
jgi:hypothetical protein